MQRPKPMGRIRRPTTEEIQALAAQEYMHVTPEEAEAFRVLMDGLLAALDRLDELTPPRLPLTWFAIAWLGLLGSCLAYLLFFYLINAWGPTRASLVTYVFPVIGLVLGILFLGEVVDWRLIAGSLLIVGGIVVVNLKLRPRPARAVASATTTPTRNSVNS